MTVVVSNTASADTFPVRKYTDGTIAIVSNHTQITASRTAFRGDVWLSKMNGGKGGYLIDTIKNTHKLNATLVSIKAQLRPVGCVENNTTSALFNFTTNEYFNCTCKAGWMGQDCAMSAPSPPPPPSPPPTFTQMQKILDCSMHTCVILDDDSVKCWGFLNNVGQLGLGDTTSRGDGSNEMGDNLPAVNLGTGRTAKAIATGSSHTCAVLNDDSVKCWGYRDNSG